MPRLSQTPTVEAPAITFVAAVPLDLMNAMYFTSLVPQIEGIDGWPERLRREMAPELLAELDFLYNYPAGDPGLMGTLGDNLITHPEVWGDVERLLTYVRGLPDGHGDPDAEPGIQGLIYQTTFRYPDELDRAQYDGLSPRAAIERRLRSFDDRDADQIMPWYDRPAELRERMARLIERFYAEHYRDEVANRFPALERSVAAHRAETSCAPELLARKLTGRKVSCLESGCSGPYVRHVFVPSLDLGPYNSCTVVDGVHGLFYPLEPEYSGLDVNMQETRLALIYKALSDEQRLRILRLLRGREMYVQEIVEATGLHQSVVSRHLSFMKAVGLVNARRQNNMKFFSVNPGIRDELAAALELVTPTAPTHSN